MAKKVIPKALLDKALDMEREHWGSCGDPLINERIIDVCMEIEAIARINWFSINSLLSAILSVMGLKHNATNEDIYAILRLLGWEVSD